MSNLPTTCQVRALQTLHTALVRLLPGHPADSLPAAGEWEGVIATFSAEGQRQQLPEHYVPEAYREWGVELYDWQAQCSSTATSSGELR